MSYEHTQGLPALLEQLELSVLLSTYQAGRVVSVGSHRVNLRLGFSRFDQAMGLCRTARGIAVGTRDAIWSLPANREIASRMKPEGEHDIVFLARSRYHSGPLMGHDLAWGCERLWLVNTLFNGLVTIEGHWSFVPQWQSPLISGWAAGDSCHLNGQALAEDGSAPVYVTALLGETDTEYGWREHKATGGCLIHVPSGEVMLRGLDCFTGHAFVGLSQSQETAVVGGLPLQDSQQELFGSLAMVDLAIDALRELLWFHRVLEELFAVCKRLTANYQKVHRTGSDSEHDQPSCLGPPVATG